LNDRTGRQEKVLKETWEVYLYRYGYNHSNNKVV